MTKTITIAEGLLLDGEVLSAESAKLRVVDLETDQEEVVTCSPKELGAVIALALCIDDTELDEELSKRAEAVLENLPTELDFTMK